MSQQPALRDVVETMLNLIKTQQTELKAALDRFIEKLTVSCMVPPETEGHTEDYHSKVNLQLHSALNLLLEINYNVYNAAEFCGWSDVRRFTAITKDDPTEVLKTVSEVQSQRIEKIEMRLQNLTHVQCLQRKQSERMSDLEQRMDGMEDDIASLSENVKYLQELNNTNFDQLLEKFHDILQWRNDAVKLVKQLETRSDEMEYDVNNVIEWHKDLENDVKILTDKMNSMESCQGCNKTLCEIENQLKNVRDIVTSSETSRRKDLRQYKEGMKDVNDKQQLTYQLILTKLHPMTQLQQTLQYLQERRTRDTLFEKKVVTQCMETSEEIFSKNRVLERLNELDKIHQETDKIKSSSVQLQFISTVIFINILLLFFMALCNSKI